MDILRQYHLSNEYVLRKTKELPTATPRYVLVTGVDYVFYPSLRVSIHTIQQQFPAGSYRLIVYDLNGNLSRSGMGMLEELRQVCHVEVREFNSTERLHSTDPVLIEPHSFAWKVLSIAEVFKELDASNELLIYFDSSIRFRSPVSEFSLYFDAMNHRTSSGEKKRLTPVQIGGSSGYSIQWATHPTMYTWLPMDSLLGKLIMREANFVDWRKTETSRQLLKWAVLCAITPECIVPRGQRVACRSKDPAAEWTRAS